MVVQAFIDGVKTDYDQGEYVTRCVDSCDLNVFSCNFDNGESLLLVDKEHKMARYISFKYELEFIYEQNEVLIMVLSLFNGEIVSNDFKCKVLTVQSDGRIVNIFNAILNDEFDPVDQTSELDRIAGIIDERLDTVADNL